MALIIKKPINSEAESQPKKTEVKGFSLADIRKNGKIKKNKDILPTETKNIEKEVVSRKVVKEYKKVEPQNKKGVSLFVDGEQRNISKTSKYLLDMLTLDNNK